jgi:spore coat protein U-like protein
MISTGHSGVAGVVLAAALQTAAVPAWADATCSFAAGGVSFGVYDPSVSTANDSAGTVTVTCSNVPPPGNTTINYALTLSPGDSGNFAVRRMAVGPSQLMYYNLYSDAARNLVWGDGSGGTSLVGGSIKVAGRQTISRTYSIYGRIPAQQDVGPGAYADTIVVTLAF